MVNRIRPDRFFLTAVFSASSPLIGCFLDPSQVSTEGTRKCGSTRGHAQRHGAVVQAEARGPAGVTGSV